MKLSDLVTALEGTATLPLEGLDREVRDIAHDSRKVHDGSLFVAVRGFHSDGHRFVSQAVRQGAVAVVSEEGIALEDGSHVLFIRVPDSRRALAQIAAAFYGHPSRKLELVGITGTNGKTTTTYLVKSIIEAAGSRAGLIGTIDYRIGERIYPAPNTTPESLDLQRLLAEMVGLGAKYCVMEVSSHALTLGRTEECSFAVAAFTNLTQDHLDFHRDMESYFRAKLLLFAGLAPDATAVVNWDDNRSAEIIRNTKARVITFGLLDRADIRPSGVVRHGIDGLSFDVTTPSGTVAVRSPLVGRHNIYNILTAVGIGTALGFPGDIIARGIGSMKAVPGRMEKVDEGQPFGVVVDYAHTEDALVRLLEAVREVARGRVITVFGCGGDRDRTKRPKMGAVAVKGSDLVIVTSDNPRTEDPRAIIREIEEGMRGSGIRISGTNSHFVEPGKTPYLVVPDRNVAINAAIGMANPGDVVVLAGKGHEDYQVLGDKKVHFDDREEARKAIRKRQKTDNR
jgi:UDP-N-acetylmuramoyl-L-alanyl-D-glutamate--2,6-diaminopimelate ligase